jgi:lipoprotein-anchoring transpeptidase ErfK/SrfK
LSFVRRFAIVAVALAVVIGFGAGAYLLVPWKGDSADAAPGAPTGSPKVRPLFGGKFILLSQPAAGATNVPPDTTVNVDVANGRITRLKLTAPDGAAVPGYLDEEGSFFVARTRLAPATTYKVAAHVVPDQGRAHNQHWSFTTIVPSGGFGARVVPGDNEVVGVGQPISVKFTSDVVNRAAVESRLKVLTNPPVQGSWHWMDDNEIHWRPKDYWPANTEVYFDADLTGVDAGKGLIGDVHRTAHFKIGASHVSIANAGSHVMTVYENGAVIKQFPMSAGRAQYPTMSGKHIVLGKSSKVVMDSRTNGIPLSDPDGYLETVLWDTQISSTGEYVHAAPWSVGEQGSNNVSHGCINLSTENAAWFYNWSQRGDIVEVTGTPRPPNSDIAMVDWKVPYEQWVAGSALYNPAVQPKVRRG